MAILSGFEIDRFWILLRMGLCDVMVRIRVENRVTKKYEEIWMKKVEEMAYIAKTITYILHAGNNIKLTSKCEPNKSIIIYCVHIMCC